MIASRIPLNSRSGHTKCNNAKTFFVGLLSAFPEFPTHQYTIFERKRQILTKSGAFYNNLPKIHPIYVIWALSYLMKKKPNRHTKFREKAAKKGRQIYVYHVNVRTPPPVTYILFCRSSEVHRPSSPAGDCNADVSP